MQISLKNTVETLTESSDNLIENQYEKLPCVPLYFQFQ